MAKLYQKYNQNTGKRLCALAGVLLCCFLFLGSGLLLMIRPKLWFLMPITGILCLVCGIKCYHLAASLHSGLQGEKRVATLLQQNLPRSYRVVANPILYLFGQTVELDAVVIGANGVQLVETKNYAGTLNGTKTDPFWTQTRLLKGGKPLTKQVKNPLLQSGRQVRLVAQWLSPITACRVQGYVFFVNNFVQIPFADARIFTDETALLRTLQLPQKVALDTKTIKRLTRAFRCGMLR